MCIDTHYLHIISRREQSTAVSCTGSILSCWRTTALRVSPDVYRICVESITRWTSGSVVLCILYLDENRVQKHLRLLTQDGDAIHSWFTKIMWGKYLSNHSKCQLNNCELKFLEDDGDWTCSICLGTMTTHHNISKLACCDQHFHTDCLLKWWVSSSNMSQQTKMLGVCCPLCRSTDPIGKLVGKE